MKQVCKFHILVRPQRKILSLLKQLFSMMITDFDSSHIPIVDAVDEICHHVTGDPVKDDMVAGFSGVC